MEKLFPRALSGLAFVIIGGLVPLFSVMAWDSGQIINNNTANANATNNNWIDINNRNDLSSSVDQRGGYAPAPVPEPNNGRSGGGGSWWNGQGPNNMDGNGNWMDYMANPNNWTNDSTYSGGTGGAPDNQPDYQPSYQQSSRQNYYPNNYNNGKRQANRNDRNFANNRQNGTFNDLRNQMIGKFQDEASRMIRDFGRHKNTDDGDKVISGNHINITY